MDNEIWKPIVGFPAYEVSNFGRVRSYLQKVGIGMGWQIALEPQRILGVGIREQIKSRYRKVHLRCNGRGFVKHVAHLVQEAFVGPCPKGMEICHNDGDPHNNHLSNLRYDTPTNNKKDGAGANAKKHLTNAEACALRHDAATGLPDAVLAQKYDVTESCIRTCRLGYTYTHAGGPITKYGTKLTSKQVQVMRVDNMSEEVTLMDLARRYKVSEGTVSRILRGLRRQSAGGPIIIDKQTP